MVIQKNNEHMMIPKKVKTKGTSLICDKTLMICCALMMSSMPRLMRCFSTKMTVKYMAPNAVMTRVITLKKSTWKPPQVA